MPVPLNISAPILSTHNPLTPFQQFKLNPTLFLAGWLYSHQRALFCDEKSKPAGLKQYEPNERGPSSITVVCISDTHNTTAIIPPGDVLLHAGDLSKKGTFPEIQSQLDWLNTLPHQHKIVIGGNHDLLLDDDFVSSFPERIFPKEGEQRKDLNWGSVTYLKNNSITLIVRGRKLSVFGSPLTPQFGNWAFQYPPIRDIWKDLIPVKTDILLTHGPPKGHLDMGGKGCRWLSRELWRKKPKLVVFGHIHGGRGREHLYWDYPQRVFDCMQAGDAGLASVFVMAIIVCVNILWRWLNGRSKVGKSTLVNATMVGGAGNVERFSPTVVEI